MALNHRDLLALRAAGLADQLRRTVAMLSESDRPHRSTTDADLDLLLSTLAPGSMAHAQAELEAARRRQARATSEAAA